MDRHRAGRLRLSRDSNAFQRADRVMTPEEVTIMGLEEMKGVSRVSPSLPRTNPSSTPSRFARCCPTRPPNDELGRPVRVVMRS